VTAIYVVVGPPAAGKSTTSKALCDRFAKSVHIPVDDLRDMVCSGRVLPSPEWGTEVTHQLALARATAVDMARRYRDAGFTIVIDDFVDPSHLQEYRCLDDADGVRKVVLHPTQDEAHRRNHARGGDAVDMGYIDAGIRHVYGLISAGRPELEDTGWQFLDTTTWSVDDTVAAIARSSQP
jgi:predicted kinase